jgi:hypothetical protein
MVMRSLQTLSLLLLLGTFTPLRAQWALQMMKTEQAYGSFVALSSDPQGNLFVGGNFQALFEAGGNAFNPVGGDDFYMAKFDPQGQLLWSRPLGGPGRDHLSSLAADSLGNLYLTGSTEGGFTFGPQFVTKAGMFVARIDGNGAPRWIQVQEAEPGYQNEGLAISTDNNGFVCATGMARPLQAGLPGSALLMRYDFQGLPQWSQNLGSVSSDFEGEALVVDPLQRIFVTGAFSGSFSDRRDTLKALGGSDIFLKRFHAFGSRTAALRYGGPGDDGGTGLVADRANNLFLTGYFSDSAAFGAQTLRSKGGRDLFVCRHDRQGHLRWALAAGGAGKDRGLDMAVDARGNLYLLGEYEREMEIGSFRLSSTGPQEPFFAQLDSLGTVRWAINLGWMYRQGGRPEGFPEQINGWAELVNLIVRSEFTALLDHFSGEWDPEARTAKLDWGSRLEINSDYFEVERSADRQTWESAGLLDAAGISLDSLAYAFSDAQTPLREGPLAYYRLRIVNFDGQVSYSPEIEIRRSFGPDIQVFPNPFTAIVQVILPGIEGLPLLSLSVADTQGRRLLSQSHPADGRRLELDLADWPRGRYTFYVQDASSRVLSSLGVEKY